jgi:ferredoxin/flavodoxin---NADP+ reductase
MVLRDLRPGRRLLLLATGTGIAPFMSIIKDPATYDSFEQVVLVRGGRLRSDLAYAQSVLEALPADEFLGDTIRNQLLDYGCVSRQATDGEMLFDPGAGANVARVRGIASPLVPA